MTIEFTRSTENFGWPVPLVSNFKKLSDAELASYIAACGFEYDGMGRSVREALVRLLRRGDAAGGSARP